jgi:C4-dicarboxylate-specific signal transduction histidine kinase
VSGNAELLEMAGGSDTVVRRAKTIAAQARRASELLGVVLAFSRESGADNELLDLADVAAAALELRKYALTKARVEAGIERTPGASSHVIGNRQELLQLLLNLLSNAERAIGTAEGGQLTLRLAQEGDRVVLTVEDNGAGFAGLPDRLPAIPRPEPGGRIQPRLGIGLRVCDLLASRHGGTLSVAARPGGGTAATLTLPAAPMVR